MSLAPDGPSAAPAPPGGPRVGRYRAGPATTAIPPAGQESGRRRTLHAACRTGARFPPPRPVRSRASVRRDRRPRPTLTRGLGWSQALHAIAHLAPAASGGRGPCGASIVRCAPPTSSLWGTTDRPATRPRPPGMPESLRRSRRSETLPGVRGDPVGSGGAFGLAGRCGLGDALQVGAGLAEPCRPPSRGRAVGTAMILGLGEQAGDALGGEAAGHVGVREHLGRSLSVALLACSGCASEVVPPHRAAALSGPLGILISAAQTRWRSLRWWRRRCWRGGRAGAWAGTRRPCRSAGRRSPGGRSRWPRASPTRSCWSPRRATRPAGSAPPW